MPRIKKIKFSDSGEYQGDTTFTSYVTLDLYYDSKYSYFYFQNEDIKENIKTLPEDYKVSYNMFRGCETEDEAIKIISFLIKEYTYYDSEKYLIISLEADVAKNKGFKSFKYNYNSNLCKGSLTIGFQRVLKLTHPRTGDSIYQEVNSNWKADAFRGSFFNRAEDKYVIIKWSEHREAVLLDAISRLKQIGQHIYDTFLESVQKDSLEVLLDSTNNGLIIDKL